ncbi:MAG: NAD(+)/NADH kinase, partial [Clostridiales bacterium]|nr:NAD(+)/NADH kinase [Clostridiales bacterium]
EVRIFRSAEEISNIDRLAVLGGDGSVLRAARRAVEIGVPIVGINYGTLGFLTEFEKDETEEAAKLLLEKNVKIQQRTMLAVKLNGKVSHCLNEATLLRRVVQQDGNRIVKIAVEIDGQYAGDFTADGIIVATPTGSTAYSLSAGGSIMSPDCATFLLTPVCAFSLRSRPIAYPDGCTLSFRLEAGTVPLLLYGDGVYLGEVGEEDVLTVTKSDRAVSFLTRDKNGFFRRLTEKIN